MRAFYYLFILFNNLLSIHIHTRGEKFGGSPPPKPLMSAAYDGQTDRQNSHRYTACAFHAAR